MPFKAAKRSLRISTLFAANKYINYILVFLKRTTPEDFTSLPVTPNFCLLLLNYCNNTQKLLVISFTWSSASFTIYLCFGRGIFTGKCYVCHEGICCFVFSPCGDTVMDSPEWLYTTSFHDRNKYLRKIYGSLWQNMANIKTTSLSFDLLWSIQIFF